MNEEKVRVPGLRDRRRYETQKAQREAAKAGVVHPRRLERSIARFQCRLNGMPESECGEYFREIIKKLPKRGRKNLLTEAERAARRGRRIVKKA